VKYKNREEAVEALLGYVAEQEEEETK